MYSTGSFHYRWLKRYIYRSCRNHHQIGSIHLSHCYHIFPWLCVWDVCCIIFCYLLHIHSGKTGNLSSSLLCSLWWVQMAGYTLTWNIVFVYLYITPSHYHHCASLSEDIELIKRPVIYSLSSVWVRKCIFSQLSIIQYVGLCVFSLPISLVMIEIMYILCLIIIIKSEVWIITHCLGLGHETMVCAVCLTCDNLSMTRLKLIHVCKREPWQLNHDLQGIMTASISKLCCYFGKMFSDISSTCKRHQCDKN